MILEISKNHLEICENLREMSLDFGRLVKIFRISFEISKIFQEF